MCADIGSDVNKIKTTITVKMGTKNRLSSMAIKGESFDDVINRLIRTNNNFEQMVSEYRSLLIENNLDYKNKIEYLEIMKGYNSIKLDNDVIKFSYNKPSDIYDEDYTMDIVIEGSFPNKKSIDKLLRNKYTKIQIYFMIIEKIINIHFDSSYSLPQNKNLLNTQYWNKIWERIQLPKHSFNRDIIKFISGIMEEN